MSADLEAELATLSTMAMGELRAEWRRRFGGPPPMHRSVDFLRRQIAWRLQEARYGGLDRATRRLLISKKAPARVRGPVLSPGVRLTREWQGRPHHVEVLAKGFLYNGRAFDSLSEVAREITGVRWNGPRFFGLRKEAKRK
jgi:hypothetical protein